MIVGRKELQNNTDEQVAEYIEKALRLVERLAPPRSLEASVFEKAVDLYSAKQLLLEQAEAGVPVPILRPNHP